MVVKDKILQQLKLEGYQSLQNSYNIRFQDHGIIEDRTAKIKYQNLLAWIESFASQVGNK